MKPSRQDPIIRQVADLRQPENRGPRGLRRLFNKITGNKKPLDPKPVVSSSDFHGNSEPRQKSTDLGNSVNIEGQKPTVHDHVVREGDDNSSIPIWRRFSASLATVTPDGRRSPAAEHKIIASYSDPTNNSVPSSTTQTVGHDTATEYIDGQVPLRHWADDEQPDGIPTRENSTMLPSL